MWDTIAGEGNVVGLQKARSEHVAERVVFLVEGEERSRGDAWPAGKITCLGEDRGQGRFTYGYRLFQQPSSRHRPG
jgi:hypothetical protein